MFRKINLVWIFSCCSFLIGFSQDFQEDINIIAKHIETVQSVAIEAQVNVYSLKGGTKVYSTKTCMYKSGENIKSVLGEIEYIETEEYYLQVDKEEKAILILKKSGVENKYSKTKAEIDIKKLQELFGENSKSKNKFKAELITQIGGIKKYKITGVDGILEMIVELNLTKKAISSVTYKYDNINYSGQYIEIKYTRFDYDSDLTNYFNLSNYFVSTKSGYSLGEKYTNYKIYTEL